LPFAVAATTVGTTLIAGAGGTVLQAAGISAAFRRAVALAPEATPAEIEELLTIAALTAVLPQGDQFTGNGFDRHACPGGLDNSRRSCHVKRRLGGDRNQVARGDPAGGTAGSLSIPPGLQYLSRPESRTGPSKEG